MLQTHCRGQPLSPVNRATCSLLCHKPTIDAHSMPCDERSCIRAEPDNGFCHFFWGTDPSDGLSGNDLCFLLGIAQASCGHRRLDVAWADAIDPDTLLRILQRCCFRQSDHTMFTGNIGGNASATD